jgi:hypothetical protein
MQTVQRALAQLPAVKAVDVHKEQHVPAAEEGLQASGRAEKAGGCGACVKLK